MEIEDLQLEILEAKRLAKRDALILQLNEQCMSQTKLVTELQAENANLKQQLAEKECANGN